MSVGRDVDYLTLDDLLEIAAGVLGEIQVRDLGLLASAATRPSTTAFGEDAYPTFTEKAAALMHSLARHRPLGRMTDTEYQAGVVVANEFALVAGTWLLHG